MSADAPDPCALVLGALVRGTLRLADVAELPREAIPGEAYGVVLELLAAQSAAGRPTQGVRLADAQRALDVVGAGPEVFVELREAAQRGPKRQVALRALEGVLAGWRAREEPRPAEAPAEAPAAVARDLDGAGEGEVREEGVREPRRPIVEVDPGHRVGARGSGDAELREIIARARAAWERAEPRWRANEGRLYLPRAR